MASTREQLRSEISFRDEVIRESGLKGRTEKLNELSPSRTVWLMPPAGSASCQIGECSNPWAQRMAQKAARCPAYENVRDRRFCRKSRFGVTNDNSTFSTLSAPSGLPARGQVTSADAALHHNFKWGAPVGRYADLQALSSLSLLMLAVLWGTFYTVIPLF